MLPASSKPRVCGHVIPRHPENSTAGSMSKPQPHTMKLHSAMARALVDHDVQVLFGLIGDGNLFMADSFLRQSGTKFISAASEAGAVQMALGYGQLTGKVGAATVTHGPGLTNSVTGLVEGTKASIPMVLLCGDTPVEDRDHRQNVAQRELVNATGAGFEQVRAPATSLEDVATAFRRAQMERRPIVLNMPIEFQWQDVAYRRTKSTMWSNRAVVSPGVDLDNAVGIIAAAKRPIILGGRGVDTREAKASILQLATRIDALVATTLKARDLFRGEAFDLGIMGTLSSPVAAEAIMESDCIIAFGASLNKFTTATGSLLRGKRVVQVNAEHGEVGRHAQPDVGLVGDPGLAADAIVYWLDQAEIAPSGFCSETIRQNIANYRLEPTVTTERRDGTVDPRAALLRLAAAVPSERTVVTDGGRFIGEAWRIFSVPEPRSFLYTINFGAVGSGLGQAIGAAAARNGRPVLLVTGDGGFMLSGASEFNTAVRNGLDLIVIVCNDGGYGAEYVQFQGRNLDPALSLYDWPDFAPLATALGGTGITVRTLDDLDLAVTAIERRDRPLLIDVKIDPEQMPPVPH